MNRGTGCTKDLQAEKHNLFEELKEVHSGQSVGRMLRVGTGEGRMSRALYTVRVSFDFTLKGQGGPREDFKRWCVHVCVKIRCER